MTVKKDSLKTLGEKIDKSIEKIPSNINFYDEEEISLVCEEVLVNYTDLGCHVMVKDSGTPLSLCVL